MVTSEEYQAIIANRNGGMDYSEVTPTHSFLNIATPQLMVGLLLLAFWLGVDSMLRRNKDVVTEHQS